ncbi:MAG: hypothetical protein EBE86_017075 [Hormoscilla sp. GUM202]|nr:hypothetical protein [Hormoscilla sp. GUM202]
MDLFFAAIVQFCQFHERTLAGAIAAVGVTPDMCYRLKIVPMGIATSCRVRVQEIM